MTERAPGLGAVLKQFVRLSRADAARYTHLLRDQVSALPWEPGAGQAMLLSPGMQACVVHRMGHCLRQWEPRGGAGTILRLALLVVHALLHRITIITTGIEIDPAARIGPGLYIGHSTGVVIGRVVVGSNCNIGHGSTLGIGGLGRDRGSPTIGDRFWSGPGSVVTGPLIIGDDVAVGANAVVTTGLPDRAVAVGVPARVSSLRGSFSLVDYPDREQDLNRAASLAQRPE